MGYIIGLLKSMKRTIREEGVFKKPSKIGTRTRRNVKFGNNVHKRLKNQEILCILKYLSFLWQ